MILISVALYISPCIADIKEYKMGILAQNTTTFASERQKRRPDKKSPLTVGWSNYVTVE